MSEVVDQLRAYVGQRVTGGCDDCAAYTEVEEVSDGQFAMWIRHDTTCPFYASRKSKDGLDSTGKYVDPHGRVGQLAPRKPLKNKKHHKKGKKG